ncbi:MAG: DUF1249 domain-containing protein [Bacterioplanes sp.]|nr:DUF1249 domain-containing protein [Bacterioplanes sp.]
MRQRYVPDLRELGALCEANYVRLCRLLANLQAGDERCFIVNYGASTARICLVIEAEHAYTTQLKIEQQHDGSQWLQSPSMHIRLYHDARMAEVLSYQSNRSLDGRYEYPNAQMRLPDEKTQLNRFLADWLKHCLRYGRASQLFEFTPQAQ